MLHPHELTHIANDRRDRLLRVAEEHRRAGLARSSHAREPLLGSLRALLRRLFRARRTIRAMEASVEERP